MHDIFSARGCFCMGLDAESLKTVRRLLNCLGNTVRISGCDFDMETFLSVCGVCISISIRGAKQIKFNYWQV